MNILKSIEFSIFKLAVDELPLLELNGQHFLEKINFYKKKFALIFLDKK